MEILILSSMYNNNEREVSFAMNPIHRCICLLLVVIMIILSINTCYSLENTYEVQCLSYSSTNSAIINEVISIAKDRIGLEYVWGGKGEIMTTERLSELKKIYGSKYYPLGKEHYIGQQAFDCSGLTYYAYEKATGVKIGYSTVEQKKILKDYKVDLNNLQPGDLVFTPGHVVLYTGKGKIVNAASKKAYPNGGVKEGEIKLDVKDCEAYRPIDYINDVR